MPGSQSRRQSIPVRALGADEGERMRGLEAGVTLAELGSRNSVSPLHFRHDRGHRICLRFSEQLHFCQEPHQRHHHHRYIFMIPAILTSMYAAGNYRRW